VANVEPDYAELFRSISRRYGGSSPEIIRQVLEPLYIVVDDFDTEVTRDGSGQWHGQFRIQIDDQTRQLVQPARTGKFVPAGFLSGREPWREICKGRFSAIDPVTEIATGEVYVGAGGTRDEIQKAVFTLIEHGAALEIDQFGASAKFLSALVEAELYRQLKNQGYVVRRMPEDTARHLGFYPSYDFHVEYPGRDSRRVEVKSLWGTDPRMARLIHSKSTGSITTARDPDQFYETSSCKFSAQDIFAVSLFLRTGHIGDFAFARSVPRTPVTPYGLPPAAKFPLYLSQNPYVNVGDGSWFPVIWDVWDLP